LTGSETSSGLWVGNGGEGAKYWLQVLTEIKNRGVADVCIVVCDGLRGLPEAIETTWPLAVVETCVLHLVRNTFRFASKADWDKIARDLRSVYAAVSEHDAKERFVEFTETWDSKYPAITRLWENASAEFTPVPRLLPRDPQSDLLNKRRRVAACPDAARHPSPGSFPHRTSSPQMPLVGGA
jgi:transposase-like protein